MYELAAHGQPMALVQRPKLTLAPQNKATPIVDGNLTEAAWKNAVMTVGFTQKSPLEGEPSAYQTVLRIVYDDEALIFGFECHQPRDTVIARPTRRDREVEGDWVAVSLDSREDGASAFEFKVSAASVQIDGLRFNDTEYDPDWDDFTWEGNARKTDFGWSAELRIPLHALRFTRKPRSTWGFQARRYISRQQETQEWALISRQLAGEVSRYGRLVIDEPLRARRRVFARLTTSLVTDWFDLPEPGVPTWPALRVLGNAGLDLLVRLTENQTLSATLFPDFGQVEADQIEPNLVTRYEISYPEKRPFFSEGTDIFATPMRLFYSRRIGAVPLPPMWDANTTEMLTGYLGPSSIYGALKYLGTLGEHVSVGVLSSLVAPNEVEVAPHSEVPPGINQTPSSRWLPARLLAPMTLYGIERIKLTITKGAFIGLTATQTNRFETTSKYPLVAGALACPSGERANPAGRCTNDSYALALDGGWRKGDYSLSVQGVGTASSGGPSRWLADGTRIAAGDLGAGGYVNFAREGGEHWRWQLIANFASDKLDYNDLGYMVRQNYFEVSSRLEYRTLKPWWRTLETRSRVEYSSRVNLSGINLGQSILLNTWWRLRNFWRLAAEVRYQSAYFDDYEIFRGPALWRPQRLGGNVYVITDPTRRISVAYYLEAQLVGEQGGFVQSDATLAIRPLSWLDMELIPRIVYAFGEVRYIESETTALAQIDSRLLGSLRTQNFDVTGRMTLTFTKRLTLQLYAQLFLNARHYDQYLMEVRPKTSGHRLSLDELSALGRPSLARDSGMGLLNLSAVLRWEYRLGSTIYLVYARTHQSEIDGAGAPVDELSLRPFRQGPAHDSFLAKLSLALE